ncbi:MAG: ActS/PrrB/RegB family redox-sensitive histidine kinase [Rhodobiaceae bacterium]|nr:ActS/PrrB/RegB family redox-sensitive histidine kinase [Rhodobiaceae bacterium]MCC0015955.1 ActS/PrrB/RegB family redox-sensitive histidine kinase [Rhodobiaceae bacterium]MCC0042453.1 ActS/PrrB/RegB family redox-sensitive histidine kinase [Rhodobiaceae bacterium]
MALRDDNLPGISGPAPQAAAQEAESGAGPRHVFTPRGLRLQTLLRLRWFAIVGQSLALVVVSGLLKFAMPVAASFALVGASVALNLVLSVRFPSATQLSNRAAMWLLGFDVVQLAGLLALNGGLHNPFSVLLAAPVIVGASLLTPRATLALGMLASVLASLLVFWHLPLPWAPDIPIALPRLYVTGMWLAILSTLAFAGVYAWRVADEAQALSDALTATELVLAREQHLSDLDGLAAAAAHELGTPLSTIALVVKEMRRDAPAGVSADDLRLLSEQVSRCRAILRKIGSLGDDGGTPFAYQSLGELVEEAVAPHRNFGIAIRIGAHGKAEQEPRWRRNPALIYGLGNIIENAVDFAKATVDVETSWDADFVTITVRDDGRGIPVDILPRLGQPYLSRRGERASASRAPDSKGLGLGIFIAKTLLERSGARLDIRNAPEPGSGAVITVTWPYAALGDTPRAARQSTTQAWT